MCIAAAGVVAAAVVGLVTVAVLLTAGFVRFSFAADVSRVREAVRRMENLLRRPVSDALPRI